jgi:hypothetical protein
MDSRGTEAIFERMWLRHTIEGKLQNRNGMEESGLGQFKLTSLTRPDSTSNREMSLFVYPPSARTKINRTGTSSNWLGSDSDSVSDADGGYGIQGRDSQVDQSVVIFCVLFPDLWNFSY